ncbi:hypothetical protein CA946_00395 [Fischerella thermalis 111/344/542]|nr:hypothetical protein CA946_00395 [Fischerella thermalis 111/344/542]
MWKRNPLNARNIAFAKKSFFLEIDHRYAPINTDGTDGFSLSGWVIISMLTIHYDLFVPFSLMLDVDYILGVLVT